MRHLLTFLLTASCAVCAPAPTVREVLDHAKTAMGGAAWDRVQALEYHGTLHASGLDGTITSMEELRTGRQIARFDLGTTRGSSGSDGLATWNQDESGDVQAEEGEEARKDFLEQRYETMRAYWFPDRAPGTVTYLSAREEGGRRFHVLKIQPEGAYSHELWVDAADWTFNRTVATRNGRTQTSTFSDYREVGGVKLPFCVVSSQGDAAFETRIQCSSISVNPTLATGAFARPKPDLGAFGIEGEAASTSLPLEFRNDHVLVQVYLNGKGPFRFFLDTGGVNVISPSVVKSLGLKAQGAVEGGGIGGKDEAFGLTKVTRVVLGSAWMGDQSFLVVPSIDDIGKMMGLEVSGVVGYELFRRFVARIDSNGTRLTLYRPESWTYTGPGITLPFTFNGHRPQVAGELDGIPGRFDLDTGSDSTLDVYAPFAATHPLKTKATRSIRTVTGAGVGGEVRGEVFRARELKLGGVTMPEPIVAIAEVTSGAFAKEGAIGNVGQGFLKRFDLVFDYSRKTITFERNARWSERDQYSLTGIQAEPDHSGRIRQVFTASPAEEAGLKAGDVILTINGRAYKDLSPDDLKSLARKPGNRLELKVQSGSNERTLVLVTREFL